MRHEQSPKKLPTRHITPVIIHPVEKDVIPEESTLLITAPSSDAQRGLLFPLRVGRFAYAPGFRLERQRFDSFLLGVVTEGMLHATIWDNGEKLQYEVRPGHVFLFDTYRHHEGRSDCLTRTSMIHFDGIAARTYYERIAATSHGVFPLGNTSFMENAIDQLLDTYTQDQPQTDLIGARILTDLLTDLALRSATSEDDGTLAVRETIGFIDTHFAEKITIPMMAQRAMMSQRQYLRKFKALTGTTPYSYLVSRRMDESKRLLAASDMPIQEIARIVGYPNLNAFTTTFRHRFGLTPMRFRGTTRPGTIADLLDSGHDH
ncbi:transcriptional regulator, AraC family [Bifidobacterium sp. DSM 109959]|uniref:Transcriptional regulator, AraC family n=2 Tax=Bifidobacterium olomucense TaxID=2675324 RepID=A0A7Y0EVP0_9BIFI|nr:AraC family transcriptional regulator [Bifidobacterium sp. DSM 109959]NMM97253.1 transcriptional regulator, AraC family [Bifidobacterium sp. DSM 109959]